MELKFIKRLRRNGMFFKMLQNVKNTRVEEDKMKKLQFAEKECETVKMWAR